MFAALVLIASCCGIATCSTTTAPAGQMMARQAPSQTPAPSLTTADSVTAVSDCSMHASQVSHPDDSHCVASGTDFVLRSTPTQTTALPAQFTGCHHHGSDMFCIGPDGEEVEVAPASEASSGEQHHESSGHRNCHFHAGVEHCVGGNEEEEAHGQCAGIKREYNVRLRVGLLFVILATSAIGVFCPILLQSLLPQKLRLAFVVLKQFGTGVIIATAFVHLYTHATLMFGNKCLGELGYEATTSAILMAGLVLSFVVEYVGQRVVAAKRRTSPEQKAKALLSTEVVSILVMEAGILFHSLLIGLTLVVAGDSFFVTLFVVILFHQVFEGLALGTRIATIGNGIGDPDTVVEGSDGGHSGGDKAGSHSEDESSVARPVGFPMKKKLGLAALFAFITPIGMAIGIGVLGQFNGSDKSTLIAIGTLDALSAGILVWVGLVEMWAADWMKGSPGHGHGGGELADANLFTVMLSGFALMAGMALMSFLGKWA
ncbi:hypothetical protein L249_7536 [Ophiocordyceps polyrhachis-furcata BCC 54312]|uniref:Uncharacterized protein n=1 Tax=Ophiocordyceps polyrhachis-furcata BCC 54312 TaxID=1330021 RepID=A0A367L9G9_9HYPO|nr:hypothetical protein L249_7536 [Ophiocordyceps polyrhachis-furcata BCC 54312]